MAKFISCPFCGYKPKDHITVSNIVHDISNDSSFSINKDGAFFHMTCNMCMSTGPEAITRLEAIEAWNERRI